MLRPTLQNALKNLPKKTNVKIGAKGGISFVYCDKIGNIDQLFETLTIISDKFYQDLQKTLLKRIDRLDNLDKIYKDKVNKFKQMYKSKLDKISAFTKKCAINKKKEKERLPIEIMSLKTSIQEWTPLLSRKVVEIRDGISPDEPNTKIIYYRGKERGNYWTIKEYQDRNLPKRLKRGIHHEPYAVK